MPVCEEEGKGFDGDKEIKWMVSNGHDKKASTSILYEFYKSNPGNPFQALDYLSDKTGYMRAYLEEFFEEHVRFLDNKGLVKQCSS